MTTEYINPKSMHSNPAYSQAVVLPAGARTMLIGGQNAVDAEGNVVGVGDLGAQTAKAVENLLACLAEAGGALENLVQVTIHFTPEDIRPGFAEWMKVWGNRPNPPTVCAARVLGLARPGYLIEISAVATLP